MSRGIERYEFFPGQWPALVGAVVGVATGIALSRRMHRAAPFEGYAAMRDLGERVADALAADEVIGNRPIEVGALTEGIVELVGPVQDEWEADRAVSIAQGVPGVRTILNRLDHAIEEDHLANTLYRYDEGDPSLQSGRWYGMGVGMGRRRQGHETDPDRTSDRAPMVMRALGTDRAVEEASDRLDKLPTGGEGHTSAPAAPTDRGTVEEASHRRLGNELVDPLQDLNPESRVEPEIKKGTRVTLERSGLDPDRVEPRPTDRG